MKSIISLSKAYFTPMLSLFLLTIGIGLITTLQTVVLHRDNVSSIMMGVIMAAYYLGFIYAAFHIEKFILRVAHIRAYATFAALFSVLIILQGMLNIPMLWIFLRLLAGLCSASLFVVIESWLLSESTPKIRGQALALYMVTYYGALTVAPYFLKLGYDNYLLLFAVGAMFCSLSIVPLSMTKSKMPEISEPSILKLKTLIKRSPSGIMGSFMSGVLLAPIYGFLPVFIAAVKNPSFVATAVSVCIFGGMVCQYPFGRLSDKIDRRLMIAVAFVFIAVISFLLLFISSPDWLWYILLFMLGGSVFVVYPLSMSHACDVLSSKDMIAATQGFVLTNGVGMVIGPLISSLLIKFFNPVVGFLVLFIVVSVAMAAFFFWRAKVGVKLEREQEFIAMPRVTPVAMEIDPRVEDDE